MPSGPNDPHFVNFLRSIDSLDLSSLKTEYTFETMDNYRRLLRTSPREAARVYWREMLYRCHFSGVASILRTRRWFCAISDAIRNENALSFAASLRGCMESSADAMASLGKVPRALARLHPDIEEALSGSCDRFEACEELEDELIHFSHARFVRRNEEQDVPRTHKARKSHDYLRALVEQGVPNVEDLYRTLSDLAHPAASTVFLWLTFSDNSGRLCTNRESAVIQEILQAHESILLELAMFGFNPGILLLRLLNEFSMHELHTPTLDRWNLSNIKGWRECEALFGTSH